MTKTSSLALRTWSSDSKHPASAVIRRLSAIAPQSGMAHKDHRRLHDGMTQTGGRA